MYTIPDILGQCVFCAFRSLSLRPPRRLLSTSTASIARTELERTSKRAKRVQSSSSRPGKSGKPSKPKTRPRRDPSLSSHRSPARKTKRSSPASKPPSEIWALGKRFVLRKYVLPQLDELEQQLSVTDSDISWHESSGLSNSAYGKAFTTFKNEVKRQIQSDSNSSANYGVSIEALYSALSKDKSEGLRLALKNGFFASIANSTLSESNISSQQELADLRYPVEWYPATRAKQRTIHLHVGPTNSGKTYHALKRLEEAETGIYAGPLRLLAHEVYSRLNAKGKPCDLNTGDDRRITEGSNGAMQSCTVEMAPLNKDMDIAVIDEIQMINDEQRGWAWTQALLGLRAKELHLCGEERTVPLIIRLAAMMGDRLEVHEYKRLSPLKMMSSSLRGDITKLRKGDCVVVFSRLGLYAMKKKIEESTGKRCAIIYGSLPPETRAQQAKLFNDPENEYDILVASDAIGMGLNLSIKRIIFTATEKQSTLGYNPLKIAEIKQIAGRAGRYRTAHQATTTASDKKDRRYQSPDALTEAPAPPPPSTNIGYVTTLEEADLPIVRSALISASDPITSAGILPPAPVIMKFTSYFPSTTPFSYILSRLFSISQLHPQLFHLCELNAQLHIADTIQPVTGLTTADRILLCAAPIRHRDAAAVKMSVAFARCIADPHCSGALLDIPDVPLEILDEPTPKTSSRGYIEVLESLHCGLVLYLWLSYRYSEVFTTRELAFYVKGLVEERIDAALESASFKYMSVQAAKMARERAMLKKLKREYAALTEGNGHEDVSLSVGTSKEGGEGSPLVDWKVEKGKALTAEA